MAKPRINFGDFSGLKEKGVSPKSLESLRNAIALGARVSKRDDLVKIGITVEEADLIAGNSSLSTDPPSTPLTVEIAVTPTDLVGYALGIQRDVTGGTGPDEALVLIMPPGKVGYTYDDAVTGALFTVFVKSPGGDFVESTLDGTKATQHTVKKADLGKKPIDVTPVPEVPNAKSIRSVAEPLLPSARIKGRLVSGNPKVRPEKRQIMIEAALKDSPADADFFPVCFAETESNGYFFTSQLVFQGPDDFKNLTAARAKVALTPALTIAIRLDPVTPARGKLPDRLILFFDLPTPEEVEDGHDAKGSCGDCTDLNFHEKKVLDEFSYYTVVRTTEPLIETYEIDEVDEIELDDILDDLDDGVRGTLTGIKVGRGLLVNFISRHKMITKDNVPILLDNIRADAIRRKVLALPVVKKGRMHLDSRNEIDWDEKPTVYQAISIAHGHLLHFKQEWFHDGYSIGDLLYSLPLAPGQKKQIVVFDWDRKESAANVQQLDYQESLYNSLSRDRDVNEVARATLNETIRGSSEASSWGVGGGLGIGAIIPTPVPIGALLGVGGGYGSGSSSARQSASRTTTASSQQQISDRTVQAANSVRSQRSTVIQTVSQGERFQVSAESVANYNHCHAMTIQYFEVLRHFEARTRLADVQECLFVPLKMSPFTPKKALRWRDILFRCLRKRFLGNGFDALYRIEEERESATENYYDKIGLPRDRFAEEELEYIEGELFMEFHVLRPRNNEADEFVDANWALWATLLGNPREFYDRFLRNEARRDDAFARHAGPRIAESVFDEIRFDGVKNGPGIVSRRLPIDATLLSDFRNRAMLNISLRMSGPMIPIKREDIDYVKISLDGATTRSNILRSLTNDESVRIIVHSGSMRYRTKNLHEHLFQSTNIKNDLTLDGDDVRVFCPLSAKALRRPRLDDVDISNELLHHLNESLEYYHQCIWSRMDAQRRFMLLDGVVAPGRSNGRSVASVVENKLIGIVGNCLVMPVAPGFKLDPVLNETVDLFEHYYEEPRDPLHVSLPTKGVFAEAVMGRCNSCEFKEEERFWRWEESPIPDNPTAINAITTPVPQVTQPNLASSNFPSPIISLQNAPAAPDPQGFGALATLLANPNLFRDLTGLSENQKNALAALQSSLTVAEQFGQGAQALTGQAAELFKFNKLTEMLGKGQITKDEFKELVNKSQESPDLGKLKGIKDAVKKDQINPETGERLNDATLKKIEKDAEKKLTDDPEVKRLIDNASTRGNADVALTRSGESVVVNAQSTAALRKPLRERYGFFGAGAPVSEVDLRDAVRFAAEGEREHWFDGGGNPLYESDPEQFGHLVRYWLARYSAIRPPTLDAAEATAIAGGVNYGQLLNSPASEADVKAAARLASAELLAGAPGVGTQANLSQLVVEALTKAHGSAVDKIPWSAAFIVSCIRKAAILLRLEVESGTEHVGRDGLLQADEAHRIYVHKAHQRRHGRPGQLMDGTYHAFHPDERAPQVGDIIVQDRNAKHIADVWRFDKIPAFGPIEGGRELHCDIVVDVRSDEVVTIGGNLSHSVRCRTYPLGGNGRLLVAEKQEYSQETYDGDATTPAALDLHLFSTGRIFALLSPVKAIRWVLGQEVDGGVLI